ncbi:DnaJ family domain-containing protein [Palleronia sp. LCG004]|uniref:DnaJ family domain-containing protein n=1 Tax=Palleronia sp. LCG004 TaxID=3079304 RepID=UPI0029438AF1|nr:DnaJ family domain-containing protein [Palleronia sp. LCG004]WOI56108.1 DUF1992 domain-containing protein [Palleronia sp. LCG004]
MSWLARIAERLIDASRDAGDLEGLEGEGKPIAVAEGGLDPLEEAGFRIMKTEGVVPPEVALMQRAASERAALAAAETEPERRAAMAALGQTQMRLAMLSERRRGLRY